jgi:hypothetical protein
LAQVFAHRDRKGRVVEGADLFGPTLAIAGAGVSNAGQPRLPIRLMVAVLYLKHAYNESDESLVERWAQDVYFQFFSGQVYFEPRLPCDPAQISRFRRVLGEAGVEQLLKTTIGAAVTMGAVKKTEFERVIVDTTVQSKAIAHPTDSRLLQVAREKVARLARRAGIQLKQRHEREGKTLRRKAGGYAEPGHKLSSGQFVPGEGLGHWPNAACKATPRSSIGCAACSSGSAPSWDGCCERCAARWPVWPTMSVRGWTPGCSALSASTRNGPRTRTGTSSMPYTRQKRSASARCDVKSHTSLSRPLTRLVTRPAVPSAVAYLCMRCWQRRRVKPREQRIGPSGRAGFREETASPASIKADGVPG